MKTEHIQAGPKANQTALPQYQPLAGIYDEMVLPDGSIRPHWLNWYNSFRGQEPSEITDKIELLNQTVSNQGIAYDLFADPSDGGINWSLNLVPLIFDQAEWKHIEAGIEQRGKLFNALILDLYGPQNLIKSEIIPAELIFSDEQFLHAIREINLQGEPSQFYTADIARDKNGQWQVIANQLERPAGLGFALANRVALTHCEGTIFRGINSLRLAPFFQELHQSLILRTNVNNPRIAVLTPGPEHKDYFSHSYIARYLGYLLVQSGDLIVQDNQIMLKTLEGLKPIHAMIRAVEGKNCDPLRLNPAGFEGATGMVQALQASNNQVCNVPGTAIANNKGLSPYLEAACQFLLGESLILPERQRWWLGDAKNQEYVLKNLGEMAIHDTSEQITTGAEVQMGVTCASLSKAASQTLKEKIQLFGANMVAEPLADIGTTPYWTGKQLKPRKSALRIYCCISKNNFSVMPGGLALTCRLKKEKYNFPDRLTQDIWITSEQNTTPFESHWNDNTHIADFAQTGAALQSRIADNLFWLGLNAERAEWTLRLCRQALAHLEEDSGLEENKATVIDALNMFIGKDPSQPICAEGFSSDDEIERLVRTLLFGTHRNYGFQTSLMHLQRLAGLTRDRLSDESWAFLNKMFANRKWRIDPNHKQISQMLDQLNEGLMVLAAFSGMGMENMTRNFSWRFLDMGRRIERATNMTEFMSTVLAGLNNKTTDQMKHLKFTLGAADSFITYRARYRILPALPAVLDLLVLDETNPRSIAFQLARLEKHISLLPLEPSGRLRSEELRLVRELLYKLQVSDTTQLTQMDENNLLVQNLLQDFSKQFPEITDSIVKHYFNLKEEQPHKI